LFTLSFCCVLIETEILLFSSLKESHLRFFKEDLSLKDCNLEVYQKEIVGWDFTINNCEESYTQGLACFNHCGWDPPVYLEETEQEVVCYETMEGVINNDLIIPCYPRPEPDSGVIQCINDCLNQ